MRWQSWRPLMILAAVGGLALAACSSGAGAASGTTAGKPSSTASSSTSTVAPSTSTTVARTLAPLTGLPVDPAVAQRPALVVKIDNFPTIARPQVGINQADVVFEEIVEGITRFAAVFQSSDADPVGPIRSARTSDINILAQLGRPLLAWSGGNPYVTKAIQNANIDNLTPDRYASAYFRTNDRAKPHNYFSNTSTLFSLATDATPVPQPLFQYRPAGTAMPPTAQPTAGVKIVFTGGEKVDYQWNDTLQGWARFQAGTPHVDVEGHQIAPANLVVLFTKYKTSPADKNSPEAQTVGSGDAWVFTNGQIIPGTWSRPDAAKPATLTDGNGQPILLTPGHTWVALPQAGSATIVPPGQDVLTFHG
ncbi:MAG TPA: DUF3048 domain-containing protein [Acidimicrobiales bacterium]|nr:DUF3048 domain-containing protein [Acidimicrobiales bacterium]